MMQTTKIASNNSRGRGTMSFHVVVLMMMMFIGRTTRIEGFIIHPLIQHPTRASSSLLFVPTTTTNQKIRCVYKRMKRHIQQKQQLVTAMSMSSSAMITLAETLAPKIGVLTSTALYFSPTKAVLRALRESNVGDLNPLPLAIMSMSSIAWLVYGLSIRDPYVTLSNIFGCIGSIGFIVGILPLIYNSGDSDESSQKQLLRQTQFAIMMGSGCILSLWTWLSLTFTTMTKVSSSLGLFASGLFCILAASPLSTIGKVVQTKNSSSILGAFTAAQVINTSLWTAYGLAIQDVFVWGPNAIGLFLGFVQLALKLLFPSK